MTPLLGALVVWNENTSRLCFQLKLANAFQQKNGSVSREVVGFSEEGKGQTVMEAQSYVAELQYANQLNDDTVFRHYFAVRRALIKQDAFTETGVITPLSFNKIEDKSFVESNKYLTDSTDNEAKNEFNIIRFLIKSITANRKNEPFYYFKNG